MNNFKASEISLTVTFVILEICYIPDDLSNGARHLLLFPRVGMQINIQPPLLLPHPFGPEIREIKLLFKGEESI